MAWICSAIHWPWTVSCLPPAVTTDCCKLTAGTPDVSLEEEAIDKVAPLHILLHIGGLAWTKVGLSLETSLLLILACKTGWLSLVLYDGALASTDLCTGTFS